MWWLTYVVLHCHTYIIFYILKNVKQHSLTLVYHTIKLLQMKKLSYYMVAIFLLSSCVKNNNSKDVGKKIRLYTGVQHFGRFIYHKKVSRQPP